MKSTKTVADAVLFAGKGATKKMPGVPLTAAQAALNCLFEAHYEYRKVAETERTKREAIGAWRDVRLEEIKNQREILERYLVGIFQERRQIIQELFERLDSGISCGNSQIIEHSLGAILSVAKQSPMFGVEEVLTAMQNKNVKVIDI